MTMTTPKAAPETAGSTTAPQTLPTQPISPRQVGTLSAPSGPEGFRHRFGLQAFIDMFMAKRMIADRGELTVKMTFLPMIRLAAEDPEAIEREYLDFHARNERVRFWDSPRERWRKYYGNFVREAEWALLKLRDQFTPAQYEEVVVGTLAALSRIDSGREIEFMNGRIQRGREGRARRNDIPGEQGVSTDDQGSPKRSHLSEIVMKVIDPGRFAGFLVGESEITQLDEQAGEAVMEVPNCAWHTCPRPEDLPRPGTLPEQGCLLICKGVFERIFDGKEGLEMHFDPHLPETSCTIRLRF